MSPPRKMFVNAADPEVFRVAIVEEGHIEELAKPTYSTCIGLILKGYSDYEHHRKQFESNFKKVEVPENLKKADLGKLPPAREESLSPEKVKNRKGLKDFWGKFKDGIIDLFKEEEDQHL